MSDEKKRKRGFGSMLAGFFVETVSGNEESVTDSSETDDDAPTPEPTKPRQSSSASAKPNQFKDELENMLDTEDALSAYQDAREMLEDTITDPATLHKAALKVAEKQGHSAQSIRLAIRARRNTLAENARRMKSDHESTLQRQVDELEEQRSQNNAALLAVQEEISALRARQSELQHNENTLKKKLAEASVALTDIGEGVQSAMAELQKELENAERLFQ